MAVIFSDRVGRRKLLILSGFGMMSSNLALFLHKINLINPSPLIPIFSLSLFYISFTTGFGGLPFVILGKFMFSEDV